MFAPYDRNSELYHWGILGMHWGIRRFQPYPKGYKGSGKEVGQAARKLSPDAQRRKAMRSEAANLKAQTELNKARADAKKAEKKLNAKPRKLSREAKKRAKERARVQGLEKDAELKRREAEAIKAKEEASKMASDSRRASKVAKENEKAQAASAKAARIRAEESARAAKREAANAAHREMWTPFHTRSGKNRAITSGDPKKINKYASRMTPDEMRRALDAYRLKEATGNVRIQKSLFDKLTFKTYRGKNKAVNSGDPKKVKRYAHLMTSDEYRRAIERCNAAAEMDLYNLKKMQAAGKVIADGISNVANVASSAISLHDSIATVYNATNKSGKKWKKWNESSSNKAKEERDKWKWAVDTGLDPSTFKPLDPKSDYYKIFMLKNKNKLNEEEFKKLFGGT